MKKISARVLTMRVYARLGGDFKYEKEGDDQHL